MIYEKDLVTLNDITIEMNLSKYAIAREGYTALDLISDVGGIQGIALSTIGLFLVSWNYNQFDNYLVERLYKLQHTSSDCSDHQNLKPRKHSNLVDCIRATLPRLFFACNCRCCKKSRLDRGLEKAREEL